MSEPKHTPPSAEELAQWQAKTDAATEGPWTVDDTITGIVNAADGEHVASDARGHDDEEYDAEFIATAREAMPRLLAEVERLAELVERGYLEHMFREHGDIR